jgi:hypothetical protein
MIVIIDKKKGVDMNVKIWFNNKLAIFLLVLVIVLGVIFIALPEGSVYAESNATPTSTPVPSRPGAINFFTTVIERIHKFQTKMLEIMSNQLNNTKKMETRAIERISELKALGKDVTFLENALDKFHGLIASANLTKEKALAALNLHQGFDAQGKVTNLKLAQETTKSVEANIKICRENIVQALKVIANGLKEYKIQNSPKPASDVT